MHFEVIVLMRYECIRSCLSQSFWRLFLFSFIQFLVPFFAILAEQIRSASEFCWILNGIPEGFPLKHHISSSWLAWPMRCCSHCSQNRINRPQLPLPWCFCSLNEQFNVFLNPMWRRNMAIVDEENYTNIQCEILSIHVIIENFSRLRGCDFWFNSIVRFERRTISKCSFVTGVRTCKQQSVAKHAYQLA